MSNSLHMEQWFETTIKATRSETLDDGSVLVYEDGTSCSAGEIASLVYRRPNGKYLVKTDTVSCCTGGEECPLADECDTLKDVFLTLVKYSFWDGNAAGNYLAQLKRQLDPKWKRTDMSMHKLRDEALALMPW